MDNEFIWRWPSMEQQAGEESARMRNKMGLLAIFRVTF
jgi:hypothetical protein